ncbi:Peptidyl-prolyl cis-trans isomerase-like 4 [Zancudomyces culisetae]|uniref:Peptidyl-prolyl cis-trans isomerase n=1 Tax=Zancudomyces culisetae TaxID=1213189 RepID=A0A1R1PQV7_ZANCU|nr:Peptidyl-prolyl cis-trans isomerase-like 4 [Zancudomyces culisetae]|eukprot:OMH83347.1 Peptidyl-prolyl cis-trans isomerase-like 4 [Zancudomyces culisetae]
MSVLIETSVGEIVIDLYVDEAAKLSLNFLKLCKVKYYNYCVFNLVKKNFIAQTGDPTCSGKGGECIYRVIDPQAQQFLRVETNNKLKHKIKGTVSMVVSKTQDTEGNKVNVVGSQFFITLQDELEYLDGDFPVFGQVVEGLDVIDKINEAICDEKGRPYRDIRIKHTVILEDPFPDPDGLQEPDKSPLPSKEILASIRIGEDEDLEQENQVDPEQLERLTKEKEAQAQALTLEMIGDLPFAEVAPPENILFVCKLNPVTRDEDLELIFSRFGEIKNCEIVRDKKTGDSLCYAFIEFASKEFCEEAYFKMENVLIDDRRIHVDFSQSVQKLHMGYMRERANQVSVGGDQKLEPRRQYRKYDEKGDKYSMVFDKSTLKSKNKYYMLFFSSFYYMLFFGAIVYSVVTDGLINELTI